MWEGAVAARAVSPRPLSCLSGHGPHRDRKPMPFPKASVVKSWMLMTVLTAATGFMRLDAQTGSPAQPAPFFPPKPASASSSDIFLELDAQRALQLGLSSIAADLYQKIFDNPATDSDVRNRVAINLATALIEEDRLAEAGRVLEKFTGLPTAAVRLRRALIATRDHRFDAAKTELQAIGLDDVGPEDRGWYFFAKGLLAEETGDSHAGSFYQQAYEAAGAAGFEAQRAWFLLAQQRLKLMAGNVTDRNLLAWRKTIADNGGSPQAYAATGQLAVGLAFLGQRAEAIKVLQKALVELPPKEKSRNDEWQLLLGLIAGAEDSVGRVALRNLLVTSTDGDRQRVALRLLARASRTGANQKNFQELLDQLIAATPPHTILEYLLLFRAQAAIDDTADKRYTDAENDATRLLAEFPNSPLKAAAYGVLTESAWEQRFYRIAATQASKARAELPPGQTHAQLGVLIAEAYFRAAEVGKSPADYRTAADAYGAALAEVPAGVQAGDLMFQRILSAIKSGQLDNAETVLDELASDPRLDVQNRWQAEWNLARALQAADETAKAYARVNRLLESAPRGSLPPDLRVSMAWLQARLSLENNEPARTLTLTEALSHALDDVSPVLKSEIASNALILQARAGFALKDRAHIDEALARLAKLRVDFPGSDAAIYSYIVEADAADADGRILDAMRLMRQLADKFEKSEYAPYALYRYALYAERQGPDQRNYNDAYNALEELVKKFPDDDLIFYARLKQGNLLRSMNEFGRARTLYAALVNQYKFPQFADALSADLALADTEATLAASDITRASNAASIYERLYDLQSAPLDLRAEAGYKLGRYRAERETADRAYAIWWPMIEAFVRNDAEAAKLGANGRYWMTRTVLELAALLERQAKPQQARILYELILEKNLPGSSLAREGLSRTGGKSSVNPAAP
jgi:TolA-binding protein